MYNITIWFYQEFVNQKSQESSLESSQEFYLPLVKNRSHSVVISFE